MSTNYPLIPVILSGGSGTRLWPLTRDSLPKQFLSLTDGDQSLLQKTLDRVLICSNAKASDVITVTSDAFLKKTYDQFGQLEAAALENIIGEPSAQDTAAAIAYAAFHAKKIHGENVMLWITPADHHVGDEQGLKEALQHASQSAQDGHIVTFGIKPSSPETAYGYIQRSDEKLSDGTFRVERFHEKPSEEKAQHYINDGNFYWNSGMFVVSVSTLLDEFNALAPEIYSVLDNYFKDHQTGRPISPKVYGILPKISFDFAIMEKTQKAAVVPCDIEWSDVGTWSSLWDIGTKDPHGNVVDGRVASIDTKDCIIHSNALMVAAIGLKDLAIIENGDSVLIADKNDSASLKKMVEALKKTDAKETKAPPLEKKPWGSVKTLSHAPGHAVKELTLMPETQTSLHLHRHRCEFWTVVSGEAVALLDDQNHNLKAQDTLFIPINAHHRIKNVGKVPLKIIEVQCGDYLGEDDIVRIADSYGRSAA